MIVEHEFVQLDVPDDATSTLEQSAGVPDVHRFFAGPVILAISVNDGEPATALGAVVLAYRERVGYEPGELDDTHVAGADDALRLEFTWMTEHGDEMASEVIAVSAGDQCATVHASVPAVLGESGRSLRDQIMTSVRLRAEAM